MVGKGRYGMSRDNTRYTPVHCKIICSNRDSFPSNGIAHSRGRSICWMKVSYLVFQSVSFPVSWSGRRLDAHWQLTHRILCKTEIGVIFSIIIAISISSVRLSVSISHGNSWTCSSRATALSVIKRSEERCWKRARRKKEENVESPRISIWSRRRSESVGDQSVVSVHISGIRKSLRSQHVGMIPSLSNTIDIYLQLQ